VGVGVQAARRMATDNIGLNGQVRARVCARFIVFSFRCINRKSAIANLSRRMNLVVSPSALLRVNSAEPSRQPQRQADRRRLFQFSKSMSPWLNDDERFRQFLF
jgi:hypothetical protein